MVKTTLVLTDEIYEQLRKESFESRKSYSTIVCDALHTVLHKPVSTVDRKDVGMSDNHEEHIAVHKDNHKTVTTVQGDNIMDKLKKLQEKKKDTVLKSFIHPSGEMDVDNYV
jgi:phosphoglycerate-specific signal transduction histidine kinase